MGEDAALAALGAAKSLSVPRRWRAKELESKMTPLDERAVLQGILTIQHHMISISYSYGEEPC